MTSTATSAGISLPVRPHRGKRVKDVHYGEYSRADRDAGGRKTVRIASAVILFVVAAYYRQKRLREPERLTDSLADYRVLSHVVILVRVKASGLMQNALVSSYLSYVMEYSGGPYAFLFLNRKADVGGKAGRKFRDPLRMAMGVGVVIIERQRETEEHVLGVFKLRDQTFHPYEGFSPSPRVRASEKAWLKIVGPRLYAAYLVLYAVQGREHDDRDKLGLLFLLKTLAGLVSVHVRHEHVEEHYVRDYCLDLLHGLFAVISLYNVIALSGKNALEEFEVSACCRQRQGLRVCGLRRFFRSAVPLSEELPLNHDALRLMPFLIMFFSQLRALALIHLLIIYQP